VLEYWASATKRSDGCQASPIERNFMGNYDVGESQGTVKNSVGGAGAETSGNRTLRFHPVTVGKNVTIRGCDPVAPHGGGLPGAARTRGGVHVPGAHLGSVDICVQPNHHILSPIDGVVEIVYPHDPLKPGVRIRGTGDWAGYEVKLFHVRAYTLSQVNSGQPIGIAVDLRPKMPGIMNHVHVQATQLGKQVNTMYMFGWFSGVSKSSWTVSR
jgi:hypothetical protein